MIYLMVYFASWNKIYWECGRNRTSFRDGKSSQKYKHIEFTYFEAQVILKIFKFDFMCIISSIETRRKFNPLKPTGYFMYRQFNIQQFYVLSTQCIYEFCVDLRTNSDYFIFMVPCIVTLY